MKNFTKQILNKALFKPTRWLFVALMFLLGTSGAWAATVTFTSDDILYFNMSAVSWWTAGTNGNGNFAYFYNNSTGKNAWSAHAVQYSGSVYYVKIPAGTWEGVILTRNNTSTAPSWDNKWNQTGDIALSSTSNYISKFSEGSTSVTWSTQKPTSTGKLTASSASVNTNTNVTLTPSLTSNTTYNEIKSTTYAISPSTGASINGNTFTATAAGTYTVTATITYNPRGYSSLTSTVKPTTTITVTAPVVTYTISYNNNGGTGTIASQTKTKGTAITLSNGSGFSKTGYTLDSWNTNSAGSGTKYALSASYTTDAALTLYAQWKINTYTITYNANNGSGAPAAQTKTYGETLTLSSTKPTRTGYTFQNWNTKADGTGTTYASGASYTANAAATLYAQWKADTYAITYNANGGSGAPSQQTKIYGQNLTLSSTVPTRTGYTFQNWNTKEDGSGTSYAKGGTYTTNAAATLYAQWKANQYTITYKDQGGANFSGTHANGYPTTHTYGTATELKTATKAGYTFGGWFTTSACTGNAVTSLGATAYSANITLYAKWLEVCEPITNLTWRVSSGEKATYCPGDKVQVTMTYNGNTATAYSRGGNYDGNIDFNASSLASGVVYTFTIRNSGTISLTLTGCDGKKATTPTLTFNVMADPDTPTVQVVNNIIKCGNDFTQYGKIRITNYNSNYSYKIGANNDPLDPSAIDANGNISGLTIADQFTLYAINGCGVATPSGAFTITETNNKPTITGNTSFQPNGSTTLTSDKGASTTWVALDGGDLNTRTGASVVFTAKENGTYHVQATYNGCSTTITIKVQDDLYVWVRRPIKKETAYDQFYHKDQNSDASKGGDLFYKEFASLPGDYQQYNQGGKAADKTCTDKDGYKWYGFVVSKTAIENDYYFTVHAPNDKGYGGFHTHTYATQLVDMEADLYFVMDETPSNVNRGWNINTPVVVRASGDAMFNGNNFADFVPLYVKDANICGKEVVSFEWQKSASQNGTYTTYKSGEGINNIRTREAGWYRCVVTYGDGKGTATSNAIQVTNSGGTTYSFTSNLPIVMVNTNGVGFPDECTVAGKKYPSAVASDMKEKISVDVIIKKGNQILYDKKARMNYRGSSSLNFKKKSYAFVSGQDSCVFDKSRHDYVKTKKAKMLNILGETYDANDKDWVMYAASADPSMIRNRLVFDLYQKMRPNDWGVHSTYVELVVDGEYKGVYVFMDKITANEKRVNIVGGTGFIVKFDKTDIVDRYVDGSPETDSDEKTFATSRTGKKDIGTYGTTVDQLFEIEYPEKEEIVDAGGSWSATVETIKQRFEDFETALEAKNYEQVSAIIDYDSWADWFILNEYTKNLDAYRASCFFTYKVKVIKFKQYLFGTKS